jgi:quercetin dioxygenase-like cupin family protein
MITEALPVILARGEGDTLHAFGEEVIVHLAGAQTGGKIALWTEITPPGGGPPPHYHLNEDELLLVQQGKMGFLHDNQWHEVGPGGVVFMPRKTIQQPV